MITIIILLLLAGITIATLGGENGLFAKVKQSKEKYSISEAKGKLELAISTLQIEQEGKGENLKKEDLTKINDDEIDVRDTSNFPIKVICNNYEFNIDSNFVVSYVGIANETIITYTTEPEGYTNKNEIKILVKIKNSKGIKTIEYPNDNDKLLANGQTEIGFDYKVTANGTYTFKIVDNDNKETTKDIVIDKFDKLYPLDFTPTIEELKAKSFVLVANVQDAESDGTNSKSGIERYEYYINGTKYESKEKKYLITGLTKNTEYSVYVIALDKAGNEKKSETIVVTTSKGDYPILTLNGITEVDLANDALQKEAYDKDDSTFYTVNNNEGIILVDSSVIGLSLNVKYKASYEGNNQGFQFLDENGEVIEKKIIGYGQTFNGKIKIPERTKKIAVTSVGGGTIDLYKFELDDMGKFEKEIFYPVLTINGVEKPYELVTLKYISSIKQIFYKMDSGDWKQYNMEKIKLETQQTVYTKGINEKNKETEIASYTFSNKSLGLEAYDNLAETYCTVNNEEGVILISQECSEKHLKINIKTSYEGNSQGINFLNKNDELIDKVIWGWNKSFNGNIKIPAGAKKIVFVANGGGTIDVYDIGIEE